MEKTSWRLRNDTLFSHHVVSKFWLKSAVEPQDVKHASNTIGATPTIYNMPALSSFDQPSLPITTASALLLSKLMPTLARHRYSSARIKLA